MENIKGIIQQISDKPKEPKKANALYYPICLLKGFEENPQITAKKIQTYCFNAVANKTNDKQLAKKKVGFVDFQKLDIESGSPMTFYNAEFIDAVANDYSPTYEEKCVFLLVCAVRSVLNNKKYSFTNWKMLVARAMGCKSFDDNTNPVGICKRFLCQSKHFRQSLFEELENTFGIHYYSAKSLHGFYLGHNIGRYDFLDAIFEPVKADKKKGAQFESKKKVVAGFNDEKIRMFLDAYADKENKNKVDADFIQYARKTNLLAYNDTEIRKKVKMYHSNKKTS